MENQPQPEEESFIQPIILPNIGQMIAILFQEDKTPIIQEPEENDELDGLAEFYRLVGEIKKEYPHADPHELGRNTPIERFNKYYYWLQEQEKEQEQEKIIAFNPTIQQVATQEITKKAQ